MKQIDVSTSKHPNRFALVDDYDYKKLSRINWYAAESTNNLYACRNITVDGVQKILRMHTVLLGWAANEMCDHRNGITLDNQRHNLRHCSSLENSRNRKVTSRSKSGYKGVSWHKNARKWRVTISYGGKQRSQGLFHCVVSAAKHYDNLAKKHFGEFARLNFPET